MRFYNFFIRLFSLENRKNNFTLQAITFYFIFFLTYVIWSFRRGTIKYFELALNSFSGLCRLNKVHLGRFKKKYNIAFLARIKMICITNNTVFLLNKIGPKLKVIFEQLEIFYIKRPIRVNIKTLLHIFFLHFIQHKFVLSYLSISTSSNVQIDKILQIN